MGLKLGIARKMLYFCSVNHERQKAGGGGGGDDSPIDDD